MQFNSVLFPAPENYYTNRRARDIIYIPVPPVSSKAKTSENSTVIQEEKKKDGDSAKSLKYIPCLYLPYPPGSNKVLVYFHGNGEDIGYSHDFLNILKIRLRVHVLAVEYPGYSLYIGSPNANQICQDAEIVYDYINQKIGIPEENIILFGRSIGSGPATHLAARRSPSALVLMSAYTSIGAVVKNIVGSFGKLFVAERFKNIDEITKVRCPILFIHGLLDQLIPKDHSVSLLNACPQTISHVMLSETMTHNEFDMDDDVINPFKKFLTNCQIKIVNEKLVYEFPLILYESPKCWANKTNKRSFMSKFYEKLAE